MHKNWIMQDARPELYRMGIRRATQGMPCVDEKNPARAYSLSLLFWGAGQSYSGLKWKGILFQVLMVLFLSSIAVAVLYGKELPALLESYLISPADVFLSSELLLLSALIFWTYNAGDAYHAAAKTRRVPFQGIRSKTLPLLSSLLVPGWGQFMNSQPLKGAILTGMAVLGFFSLVTIPAVLMLWPSLQGGPSRSVIEAVFAATVLYAPCIPLVWLYSAYDAFKVSRDDLRKESLLDRLIFGIRRWQSQGWIERLFSPVRTLATVALFLGLVAAMENQNHFSTSFYDSLAGAQEWMQSRGMTVVPEIMSRMLSQNPPVS